MWNSYSCSRLQPATDIASETVDPIDWSQTPTFMGSTPLAPPFSVSLGTVVHLTVQSFRNLSCIDSIHKLLEIDFVLILHKLLEIDLVFIL